MSHNTFGHLFRVTTFGESHGRALGCVIDGCPPRLPLSVEEIQRDLIAAVPANPGSLASGGNLILFRFCRGWPMIRPASR